MVSHSLPVFLPGENNFFSYTHIFQLWKNPLLRTFLNSWRNCQYSTLFSPKQYIVTTLQDDLSLPLSSPTEPNVFLKRAKGVKRNIIKDNLTYNHYASLARDNIQCPSSKQYSLARKDFTIFMTQNRKIMLSKQNNKRLFYDCMQTPSHHFSLPLDAKYLLDWPKDKIWQNAIFVFCYFSCLFLLQFFLYKDTSFFNGVGKVYRRSVTFILWSWHLAIRPHWRRGIFLL